MKCPLSPQLALRLVGPSRLGPVYISSCQTHRNMIELFVRASFRAPGGHFTEKSGCGALFVSARLHHLTLAPASQGPFGFGYIIKLPVYSRVNNIVLKIRRPGTWWSRLLARMVRLLLPPPHTPASSDSRPRLAGPFRLWIYNQTASLQP